MLYILTRRRRFTKSITGLFWQRLTCVVCVRGHCNVFNSYLSKRENLIRVSGSLSQPISATSGVPRGTNLGPILFLFFINCITLCVTYSKFLLFADDTNSFRLTNTVEDCVCLQRENGLVLNELKTKVIFLRRKRGIMATPLHFRCYSCEPCVSDSGLGFFCRF